MNLPNPSRPRSLLRGGLLCLLGAVAGCNVIPPAQEDATRYYILSDPAPPAAQAAPSGTGARIGLRAVRLAGYLKRRDIVVRKGPNEVDFRDFRLWAEPLDAAIARSVRSTLLSSPAVAQVWAEPFPVDQDRDFDVSIEVTRCEGAVTASGKHEASFSAAIEVSTTGANAHVVARRRFDAPDAPWDGTDFERLAALLSGDVAGLGRDVLAAVPAKD